MNEVPSVFAPLSVSEKQPTPLANAEAETTFLPAGMVKGARSCVPEAPHWAFNIGLQAPISMR